MKALSIKQPWASLIVRGAPIFKEVPTDKTHVRLEYAGVLFKDIENRRWGTTLRGRVYIHASKKRAPFESCFTQLLQHGIAPYSCMLLFSPSYAPTGAIIGEVDIVDCVEQSDSPWFEGPKGLVLANPKAYIKPLPYRSAWFF